MLHLALRSGTCGHSKRKAGECAEAGMSRSTSPHQSSSTELQAPSDQSAPELPSLGQLCSLLQSLAFSHTHSPSLFDADNLCLYCETPLTHTSPSTGALLLLPSTIELPCGHRLCRTCYSGASSRRRTCPIPLCNRALPLESIAAVSSPSAQFPLSNPMIKSKSEPSLFPLLLPASRRRDAAAAAPPAGTPSTACRRLASCPMSRAKLMLQSLQPILSPSRCRYTC